MSKKLIHSLVVILVCINAVVCFCAFVLPYKTIADRYGINPDEVITVDIGQYEGAVAFRVRGTGDEREEMVKSLDKIKYKEKKMDTEFLYSVAKHPFVVRFNMRNGESFEIFTTDDDSYTIKLMLNGEAHFLSARGDTPFDADYLYEIAKIN